MLRFHELIKIAYERQASDLHLSAGRPACCRVNGDIKEMLPDKLTPEDTRAVADEIMNDTTREKLERDGQVDFACYDRSIGRFRVNIFYQRNSLALVARILNPTIPLPETLGLSDAVINLITKKRGLILVTGPTGSGKSTTLASLINRINQNYERHIITLEDPIEYLHPHAKSTINQREIGTDARDFPSALHAALRQDPDVILIGEMRDLETISTAITAAETGHLVFSTLHTIGAANTIDRIIDVFPPYQQQQVRTQLADVLEAVVSQQLVPTADGKHRKAAIEVMLSNPAVRNSIRENKIYQITSVMQTSRKTGMITMDEALMELQLAGEISKESALNFAQDRVHMAARMMQ